MCANCCGHCKPTEKPVKYKCDCPDCECSVVEFDKEPETTPHCCGKPMKRT